MSSNVYVNGVANLWGGGGNSDLVGEQTPKLAAQQLTHTKKLVIIQALQLEDFTAGAGPNMRNCFSRSVVI